VHGEWAGEKSSEEFWNYAGHELVDSIAWWDRKCRAQPNVETCFGMPALTNTGSKPMPAGRCVLSPWPASRDLDFLEVGS